MLLVCARGVPRTQGILRLVHPPPLRRAEKGVPGTEKRCCIRVAVIGLPAKRLVIRSTSGPTTNQPRCRQHWRLESLKCNFGVWNPPIQPRDFGVSDAARTARCGSRERGAESEPGPDSDLKKWRRATVPTRAQNHPLYLFTAVIFDPASSYMMRHCDNVASEPSRSSESGLHGQRATRVKISAIQRLARKEQAMATLSSNLRPGWNPERVRVFPGRQLAL